MASGKYSDRGLSKYDAAVLTTTYLYANSVSLNVSQCRSIRVEGIFTNTSKCNSKVVP
jgi:hypothetical protein